MLVSGSSLRTAGVRSTTMTYDADNRLASETVSDPATGVTTTAYAYDAANNRLQKSVTGGSDPGVWHYTYNEANQLTSWEQWDVNGGTLLKSASLGYDASGNRISQSVSNTGGATGSGITPPPAASGTTSYQWDAQDRLSSVTLPDGQTHAYDYDYRTRRIGTHKLVSAVQQAMTAIVFAGGLSLAEFDTTTDSLPAKPTVEYTRGPDMGGGVGGMLYSLRSGGTKYSLSNGRGDIVAQADSSATLTWTASYEAYGRRTQETGSNADKQRGNSKDEDPTGLLNEGFRYRDLETGVWLSRDPAGFVDGPNVYAYVKENPWTSWDPEGLEETKNQYHPRGAKGLVKLEGSRESGEPLTRFNEHGKLEVQANHYESWSNKNLGWFNGPYGAPDKSEWEPAAKYGVTQPTSSARGEWGTNVQRNMQAIGEGANKPLVKGLDSAIRTTFTEGTNIIVGAKILAAGFYVLRSSAGVMSGASSRLVPGGGLLAHENAGGHLLARHVGQTEGQLASRLVNEPHIAGASTFGTRSEAEAAISHAFDHNATQVSNWVSGGANGRLVINAPWSGGSVLQRGATATVPGSGVRAVLKGNGSGGYHILTGHPTP